MSSTVSNISYQIYISTLRTSKESINRINQNFDNINVLPLVETTNIIGLCYLAIMEDGIYSTSVINNIQPVAHILTLTIHRQRFTVADIINVLVREPAIGYCIATTLQGIYKNSTHAVHDLYSALLTRNIKIVGNDSQNKIILLSDDNNLYPLYYNFNQSIANVGRARTNKIGVFNLSGRPDIYGDCIMIDNNDVLRLNNVRGAKIDGRPILEVIEQLQRRVIQR